MSATAISRRRRSLNFTRPLDASPTAVYALFADPLQLARWWSPPECPIVESTLDFRPGGVWHYKVRSTQTGEDHYSRAVFREIEPGARIVFTETSADAAGAPTGDRPPATTTVTLTAVPAGTRLEITVEYDTSEARDAALERGVASGLTRALDQLVAILGSHHRKETPTHA